MILHLIRNQGGILESCVLAEEKKAAYPAGESDFFSSAGPTRAGRIRHEPDYDFQQRYSRGIGRCGGRQLP